MRKSLETFSKVLASAPGTPYHCLGAPAATETIIISIKMTLIIISVSVKVIIMTAVRVGSGQDQGWIGMDSDG